MLSTKPGEGHILGEFDPDTGREADDEDRDSWMRMATAFGAWLHDPELGKTADIVIVMVRLTNPYLAEHFSID